MSQLLDQNVTFSGVIDISDDGTVENQPVVDKSIGRYMSNKVALSTANGSEEELEKEKRREDIKKRVQQRSLEINELNRSLLSRSSMDPPPMITCSTSSSKELPMYTPTRITKPQQTLKAPHHSIVRHSNEPFDFQKIQREKDIAQRAHQFCSTHNRLEGRRTKLMEEHAEALRINSRKRFMPSCKQRAMYYASRMNSLSTATPTRIEEMMHELELKSIEGSTTSASFAQPSIMEESSDECVEEEAVREVIIGQPVPHQPSIFDESFDDPFVSERHTSLKTVKIATRTQFTQWNSSFGK